MTDIVIQGAMGRMGHQLAALIAKRDDCRVVAGIDAKTSASLPFPVFNSLQSVDVPADVLVDFSLPQATAATLPICAEKGLPCVICTTGLGEDVLQLMKSASQKTAMFYSANMSLGINLMAKLIQRAAAALPGFDIEIIEKHHHNKLDAPSGTAMMLADTLNKRANGKYRYVYNRHDVRQKRNEDEIGIHAVRGGSIVGEHEVIFAGPDEVFALSHTAYSRDVFANGAIAAALFLKGQRPGMYNMENLLGDM